MKPEQIREAIEAVYEVRDYSGRAMFGKSCVGITVEDPIKAVLEIVEEFYRSTDIEEEPDALPDLCYELKNHRVDTMGLGSILYWPEIPWEEDE